MEYYILFSAAEKNSLDERNIQAEENAARFMKNKN